MRTVRAAVAVLKGRPARSKRSPEPLWRRPTPHRAVRALLSDVAGAERDQHFYDALLAVNLEIRRAVNEARAFVALVRARNRTALASWLEQAKGGPLAGFAEGLRRDHAAVDAALVHPWSTGPVEGQITRLKLIKRAMAPSSTCFARAFWLLEHAQLASKVRESQFHTAGDIPTCRPLSVSREAV